MDVEGEEMRRIRIDFKVYYKDGSKALGSEFCSNLSSAEAILENLYEDSVYFQATIREGKLETEKGGKRKAK